MVTQKAYARFAGIMYLFTVFDVTGVVILSRVTGSRSFVDAAHSVASSETLYRIALLCGLVGTMSTILLAVGLYVTLKPVDGNLAMMAMLFRLAESVLGGMVLVFGYTSLQIYLEANQTTGINAGQLGTLADLVSRTSAIGTDISVVFFSVGSTIFFYLFLKSDYIPRVLATWGLAGSFLCLVAFAGNLVLTQSSDLLLGIAEPVVGLWLVTRGIKTASHS